MAEVDGTEALIEGFGEFSGRFQRELSDLTKNDADGGRRNREITRQTHGLAAKTGLIEA